MAAPDGDPEPVIELTGLVVVPLPVREGSGPEEDPGPVDAVAPTLPIVVALELQADVVRGGLVVSWGGVVELWQTGGVEPASAETAAV